MMDAERIVVRLDMETYSEADLPKVGAWTYAEHSSTDVLCIAYRIGKGKIQVWLRGQPKPADLIVAVRQGCLLRAFNANFERAIWTRVLYERFGWDLPVIDQWECTQAVAAYCAYPLSLGACAAALGTDAQKDKDGKRLIKLFCMPRKATKKNPSRRIFPKDEPEEFRKLVEYCIQDVSTEEDVAGRLPVPTLPSFERRVWRMDSLINERGVLIDAALCRGAMKLHAQASIVLKRQIYNITDGKVKEGNLASFKKWLVGKGIDISDGLDKDAVSKLLSNPKLPDRIRKALKLRQSLGLSSAAKYPTALAAAGKDGRVRGIHQYCAAHTHRWGGRMLQMQNPARPKMDVSKDIQLIRDARYDTLDMLHGDVMGTLRDAVRHVVVAAPGRKLLICDKSSIEARVLGWLAEDEEYNTAFRMGLDLYKVMASKLYDVDYNDVTDEQRHLGKVCILALGYSMWYDTFMEYCKVNKVKVDQAFIKKAVDTYRETFYKIPLLWKNAERAMLGAAMHKRRTKIGAIAFEPVGDCMTMILPTKTRLWYPEYEVIMAPTKWGTTKPQIRFMHDFHGKWLRTSTYGGRIVENAVQKISRDILAQDMLDAEMAGMETVMHVHDEAVPEVDPKQFSIKDLAAIMKKTPEWAPGLLMDAKGIESPFYRK